MPTHVDASFLIAMADRRDQWHEAAERASPALLKNRPWVTHALALGEAVAIVGGRCGGKEAKALYDVVRDTMQIVTPTLDDMDASMPHVLRHDGALSLSDALFLHYMGDGKHGKKPVILSFDSDFDKAGVKRMP